MGPPSAVRLIRHSAVGHTHWNPIADVADPATTAIFSSAQYRSGLSRGNQSL